MTPNDSEMDVLLRRYAHAARRGANAEHLDADELIAFAEGALPAAARSKYVSHLADCDDCRRAVTELAAASGRIEQMAVPASEAATESWWQRVGAFFAPARLRYAAFAAVLIAVVGIGFAVWRQSREQRSASLASNPHAQQADSERASTESYPQEPNAREVVPQQSPPIAKGNTQAPLSSDDQKQPDVTALSPPPPPKPVDNLARNEAAPSAVASGRAAEPSSANAAAPSYAPPPTVETEQARVDNRAREQQNLSLLHGPQRGESMERNKSTDDRARGGEVAKARDEDRVRAGSDQPAAKEENKAEAGAARKRSESRTAPLASRPSQGVFQESPKSDKAGPPAEADTRSVGGRKFKRQGNAWVDVKLKSSMAITTVSRRSEDFEKLDSGLRSIAQQFGGPVVVVWKGKAYRIQ